MDLFLVTHLQNGLAETQVLFRSHRGKPAIPTCMHPPCETQTFSPKRPSGKKKPTTLCAAFSVTGWECSYFAPDELICRTVAERPPARGDGVVITKPWLTFARVFSTCLLEGLTAPFRHEGKRITLCDQPDCAPDVTFCICINQSPSEYCPLSRGLSNGI